MSFLRYYWLPVIILLSGCNPNSSGNTPVTPNNPPNLRALSAGEVAVIKANNDFGFNLFREVKGQSTDSNILISPLSVSMALGMLQEGAGDATEQSIRNTIKFGNLTAAEIGQAFRDLKSLLSTMDRTVELDIASSAWHTRNDSLTSLFQTSVKYYYGAKVDSLNFSDPTAIQTVNTWITGITNGNIPTIITQINPNDIIFLINAIFFNGDWAKNFDETQTKDDTFVDESHNVLPSKSMFVSGVKILYLVHNNFTLIDLPYGNEQFSMTLLLPDPGNTVHQITGSITADSLNSFISQATIHLADIRIPKFKMDWKKDIKSDLSNLGVAMDGYTNIFQQPVSFEIAHVTHQSSINLVEDGSGNQSVDNGVTSVGLIELNRPFLYFIREKHSGVILYMGQLHVP